MAIPQLLEPEALREVAGRRLDKKVLVLLCFAPRPSIYIALPHALPLSLCRVLSLYAPEQHGEAARYL